jgi:hypothetical protein
MTYFLFYELFNLWLWGSKDAENILFWPEANFFVILCTCGEELRSGRPVQYLNNMSHGQNLRSTSDEPEFIVQKFFEIPASAVSTVLVTAAHGPNNYKDSTL